MSNISFEESEKNYQKMEELLKNQRLELLKTKKALAVLIEEVRKEKWKK